MLSHFVRRLRVRVARRDVALMVAVTSVSLLASSVVIAILEAHVAIPDASAVYMVAVVVMATLFGTTPAALTALAAFGIYDYFFTQPYLTFLVADPAEWVNLVLFLLIAVVVGRLAARQRERAVEADRRAREAQALFAISRTLATATSVAQAAPAILARLASDTAMSRIWFAVSAAPGGRGAAAAERTLLDSAPDVPRPRPRSHWTLLRTPGDRPAQWLRTHIGAEAGERGTRASSQPTELFRVKIEADGAVVGSLWATRQTEAGAPNREETRLLALAADQLGLAVHRDELTAAATASEVARQSDALKSALLTSVSHDLRTPLAGIRAAAGTLLDPDVDLPPEGIRATARAIDTEADRLNRLVRNLLDLGRIEAGALRPDLEVLDLEDLVDAVRGRTAHLFMGSAVTVDLPVSLPAVRADAVYLDEALSNLLENAARHAGEGAVVRVAAERRQPGAIAIRVEDSGPGVPAEAMPRLFEKFQRSARGADGSRQGMGVGLSLVKGLVEAMGGSVEAQRSALGGLRIDIVLQAVDVPADPSEATDAADSADPRAASPRAAAAPQPATGAGAR